MKKALLIIALAMILPAGTLSSARAEGGKIRFGNLAIVPSFCIEEIYDDNIFYAKTHTVSDWITHYRPGLMLDYTITGRGKVKLGYVGDYAYYNDNTDNDWKSHRIFLDLDYLSPGGLIAKIKNELHQTEDPYGDPSEYNLGVKSSRWSEDLQSAVGFQFSNRFKILAYYNFYRQDYKNNNAWITGYTGSSGNYSNREFVNDYYFNEAGLGFETRVSHKTWLFLRYHNGSQRYFTHRGGITGANDAAYDWHRVNTGIAWDDGGRLRGELNFGYQWNSYKNSFDRYGKRYKDQDNWIAETCIDYRQTEARSFRFKVSRALYQLDAGAMGNYTDTLFGISVRQKIRRKFFLDLAYDYSIHKYNGEGIYYTGSGSDQYYYASYSDNRKDTIHHLRAALDYVVKEWLTARIEYNYYKDHSNESLSGYTINRVGISLNFKPAAYH